MTGKKTPAPAKAPVPRAPAGYAGLHSGIVELLESARRTAARTINALMTAAYWEIGRRIVETEQKGKRRAEYGERLVERLAADLTARFGRGFSRQYLQQMRMFYLSWPLQEIRQTLSSEFVPVEVYQTAFERSQTLYAKSSGQVPPLDLSAIANRFPLPWSAYVRLLSIKDPAARAFYETEALRGGWMIRQLDRQINSQFYQRVALSRNKAAMLAKGEIALPEDTVTPEEAIKDPYVLEFLNLKDEYSESDIEDAAGAEGAVEAWTGQTEMSRWQKVRLGKVLTEKRNRGGTTFSILAVITHAYRIPWSRRRFPCQPLNGAHGAPYLL